jgi:hypothetical protein
LLVIQSLRPFAGAVATLIAAVCFCLFPTEALSQQSDLQAAIRSAPVTRITTPIAVDGLLDEPPWLTSPKIGELIQREPDPGTPPSERTEVTLLHDDQRLYIGVVCFDSQPNAVIGTQMARDADLGDDDRIEIVLDTYRDRRNAYYFATNPAGALVDGLIIENRDLNRDWDAIWMVRTRRNEQGWIAEFAIPFKSLGFPSGAVTWGFNLARNIQRKLEDVRWTGARLDVNINQVSEGGDVIGLEDATQGIGLDIRPFVAGRWLHSRSAGGDDVVTGKPGLDAFYNITSNLKLSLTGNTDFGETEADARQINLTRFALFFPEKRTFFLENVGIFDFANTGRQAFVNRGSEVMPFFSRRIGLLEGEEVPIDVGAKLTGKIGNTDIGILDVRTRDSAFVTDKNFFVGRVKQNFLQQSYIGAIFTDGNPADPISSQSYGLDLHLGTSRIFGLQQQLVFDAWGVRGRNEGISNRDWAYGFSAEYPNDLIGLEYWWREIQENFQPALGFAPRTNIRQQRIGVQFSPRPANFLGIRQMSHTLNYTRFTRLDSGQLESSNIFFVPVNWQFNSGDSFRIETGYDLERLFEPFEISEAAGVVLPPGDYRTWRIQPEFQSATKRRLEVQLLWQFGEYWSGRADLVQATLRYKLPPYLVVSFTTDQTFARLPEGNFVARVLTWRVNLSATPFLTFSNLIQFDNESRNLGWQSRTRWIMRPGNDLFVVFSQGWLQDPLGGINYTAQDSRLSTKFQYTFRF